MTCPTAPKLQSRFPGPIATTFTTNKPISNSELSASHAASLLPTGILCPSTIQRLPESPAPWFAYSPSKARRASVFRCPAQDPADHPPTISAYLAMVLVPGLLPPSRENWELINYCWQFFPLFTGVQWLTTFYPQGKTSIESRLNLPGKWAWAVMEAPGFITLLYNMVYLPRELGIGPLPWANWTMAGLYTLHYSYRAVLAPLVLNPSMSPIHPLVFASALAFNLTNALCLSGWLAGYGPTTAQDWAGRLYAIEIGLVVWGWALLGNIFHDDDLREIRRAALRRQREQAKKENKPLDGVDKLYMLPKNGLFHYVLFPHYLCEWIEWTGFWIIGGLGCTPARSFLFNEISTMLPRALQGKAWYVEKFGKERVGNRKAIIPGLL
ncbi:hypothetical protein MBLNU459_g6236t1 [Dothideomycetes sp. NU459]